jgi:WD40 repeat protein
MESPFRVLDIASGSEICSFGDPLEFASFAMFSPDGTQVLTVGGIIKRTVTTDAHGGVSTYSVYGDVKRTARLWDAATGTLIANLNRIGQTQGGSGNPCPALFSPDGKRIVTLDIDRAAMYDNTGKQLGILEKSDRPQGYSFIADRVYFSPDSKECVVRTIGGFPIRFRSTTDASLIAEHQLENGNTNGFDGAFSSDGTTFACSCFGWLYLIDPTNGSLKLPPIDLAGNDEGIWYSPDGLRVFVLIEQNMKESLVSVDTATGKVAASAPTTGNLGSSLNWIQHGQLVVLSTWNFSDEIFDARTLKQIGKIVTGGLSRYSDDRSRFICQGVNSTMLEVFTTSPMRKTSEIRRDAASWPLGYFKDAMFRSDPGQLLTATDQGTVQLWLRRRPEIFWGIFYLPQCWLAILFTAAFLWGVRRDVLGFYRPDPPNVSDADE